MTTVVDTVVPVARGQIRRSSTRTFLVLAQIANNGWKVLILDGPMQTDVILLPGDWIERWSTVVEP